MKYLVVSFIVLLSGCVVVHDKTNEAIAEAFIGSYFALVKDGYLYEGRCADVNAGIQSTEWCTAVQAFNSGNEYSTTPKDYQQYLASKASWDQRLFTKLAFEKQRTIIKAIPKGTVFKMTRLVQYPWGSNGYYWAIRAEIVSGDNKGLEIELPTNSVLAFPTWLSTRGTTNPPEFDSQYMKICANEKCT
ncbi:hypothetical protein Misp06_03538 [Microbulbifer sp. NBRC 101763]|uniref:hypothetical protein n=1 Tax=unclassified Microbulbifer TaxID=2619833 RepID=UPI0024AD80FD|nr:hypothetical protein [Microbulbifer sp. MLAF003]WHI50198.1 hypothetical protein P3339_17350 [Microbulbifer sp. MLAF003]